MKPGGAGRAKTLVWNLPLAAIFLLVAFIYSPAFWVVPGRDSCGYLYAAQQMLQGQTLYRDLWDHKGPVIYFVSALGLALTPGALWGVWFLEAISLGAATFLGFTALRRIAGTWPSLAGCCAALLCLPRVLEYPNLTEEYALPLTAAALLAFAVYRAAPGRRDCLLLIGLCAGLGIMLKQNVVGGPAVAMACILLTSFGKRLWRRACWEAAWSAAGTIIAALPFLAYFTLHGALGHFWDCAYRYNLVYTSNASWVDRVHTAKEGLLLTWDLRLVAACVVLAAGQALLQSRPAASARLLPWWFAGTWSLVELALASMSGRVYLHYYVTLLPPLALLVSLAFRDLWELVPKAFARFQRFGARRWRVLAMASAAVASFWLAGAYWSDADFLASVYRKQLESARSESALRRKTYLQMATFVDRRTGPEDTVLLWGAEPGINFLARRRAPTRFYFQNALYTPGYQTPLLIQIFLNELKTHPPAIIIDTSFTNPEVPPIRPEMAAWVSRSGHYRCLPEMAQVWAYFSTGYRPTFKGRQGWVVYERVAGGSVLREPEPHPSKPDR